MPQSIHNAAILGASGYTGAETARLLATHPRLRIGAVTGNQLAGKLLGEVFPHLGREGQQVILRNDDVDWDRIEVAFGCLPHGTSQDLIETLPEHVTVVDLSADYRLRDASVYAETYGRAHINPARAETAIYGLTEHARDLLPGARLVACPGCYPTAALLALIPPVAGGALSADGLIIDAKSGVSGAGRSLKETTLFCETAEGVHPYAIGTHRHAPEIEQEISRAAGGGAVTVTFTPHLVPMTRGEMVTIYGSGDPDAVRAALRDAYAGEPFVSVLDAGDPPPDTRHVRGTNQCRIGVYRARRPGQAIIVAVIDNLTKGSSGQAVQNLNVMMGWPETLGLEHLTPLFP